MTLRTNTAEGGTNGTAVTAGNSGGASGDAFGTVSAGAGGTIAYSSATAAHGSLSIAFTPASATLCYVVMNDGATSTSFTARAYLYLTGLPSAETILLDVQGAAGGTAARLHLSTTGTLKLVNTAGSVVSSGTQVLALNTWYRIALHGNVAASATVRYALYAGDSSTPLEQFTSNAFNSLNASGLAGRTVVGRFTATGTMATFHVDDFAANCESSTEIGPVASSPQPVVATTGAQVGATALPAALNDADDTTGTQGASIDITIGSGALTTGSPNTPAVQLRMFGTGGVAGTIKARLYAADGTTPLGAEQTLSVPAAAGDVVYALTAGEAAAWVTRTMPVILKLYP
jgi:hypothetical protein